MKKTIILALVLVLLTSTSMAAEKRQLQDIDSDSLTKDTQVMPQNTGDDHMSFVWWLPNEFWGSIFARDLTTSQADKDAMLESMSGVTLLAVVQADITSMGSFNFYSQEEIESNLVIIFTDEDGAKHRLSPLVEINPDLEIVLGVFKPILGSAMGNLGKSMYFFVLNDVADSSDRLVDPYMAGNLNFHLVKRNGDQVAGDIELPLDSLYIPRKCPNGKDAHISWTYCPWSGMKLAD